VYWFYASDVDNSDEEIESDEDDEIFTDNNCNTRSEQFQLFELQHYILQALSAAQIYVLCTEIGLYTGRARSKAAPMEDNFGPVSSLLSAFISSWSAYSVSILLQSNTLLMLNEYLE
jgi:hypothetical protein